MRFLTVELGAHYGHGMPEPVVQRVVAIEDLHPGSPATRRVVAEWSDGSRSEALAWFADLSGHPDKSAYAESRVMPSVRGGRCRAAGFGLVCSA